VAAVQLSATWPTPPVAARPVGALGSSASGVPTLVFMSASISAAGSARLYTRTSSIRPSKRSPQTGLAPIVSVPVDVAIAPLRGTLATWAPLMNIFWDAPS
jgi:hypothetical protein